MAYINSRFKKVEELPEEAYTAAEYWPMAVARSGTVYSVLSKEKINPFKDSNRYYVRCKGLEDGPRIRTEYGRFWADAFIERPSAQHIHLTDKDKKIVGLRLITEEIAREEGLHWSRTPASDKELILFDCVEKEIIAISTVEFGLQVEEKCPEVYERYIQPRVISKDGKLKTQGKRAQHVYEAIRDGHLLFKRFYVFNNDIELKVGEIIHVTGNENLNNRFLLIATGRRGEAKSPSLDKVKHASIREGDWIQPGAHFTLGIDQDYFEVQGEIKPEKAAKELNIFTFNFKLN